MATQPPEGKTDSLPSKRLAVGGSEWEVHYTPSHDRDWHYWVAFKLVLLGAPRRNDVKVALRCWLLRPFSNTSQEHGTCFRDASGDVEGQISHAFKRAEESSGWVRLRKRSVLESSGIVKDDSLTVECTITVITELPDAATDDILLPSSGLHHHLGELLQNGTGADVTLVVSGESFPAHKAILASRSPVFMAEFFEHMKEKRSQRVEISDMEAAVFGAMLRCIYTDSAPELDRPEDGMAIAQHLIAAADRYGIDRLKLICENKLYDSISIDTTLALAQQHGCSLLKAVCVELIAANLEADMATEGYTHLMASCPSVMDNLLKAVRGREN